MPDHVKHPKPHRRLVQEPMVFGQGLGHARLIHDLAQMRQDRLAEFAEQDFLALTVKNLRPKLLLQRLDRAGQCRLRDVAFRRRLGEI